MKEENEDMKWKDFETILRLLMVGWYMNTIKDKHVAT